MADEARVAGEEELIQGYLAPLAARFPGSLGLKDDCAVLTLPPGHEFVVTTDAVAAGVHFFPDDDPGDIAWKALAVNVSDLVAKGAKPIAYLMALALPQAPTHDWLFRFSAGLGSAQDRFGIALAGGDTDRRAGPLAITITAIGSIPKGRFVKRSTARQGDILFVSGTLGNSALGLKLCRDPALARSWRLTNRDTENLVRRYLRPEPRVALAPLVLQFATAAMDISDGLAKDLGRMVAASGVGARVLADSIPLSPSAARALTADRSLIADIVAGGDDYEVLATVAPADRESFGAAAASAGVDVTEIGEIDAGPGVVIEDAGGNPLKLVSTGWDHL